MKVCALRALQATLQVPLEKETFQDTEATLFHNLPDNLKKCDDSYLVHTFLKSQRARHNSSQLLLIVL